jgi:glycosyltransferase involved in cell wall biosynthesis
VAQRVKKHYDRDSLVIYPPVEIDKFLELVPKEGDYFFTYGRLVAHKRTDIIVETFNDLGWKLKIAGSGRELDSLKSLAKGNIEFLGRVSDVELKTLLANCKALIFAANEDFGIVPVEAMAAGKSVVAFEAGGVLESIIPKLSGEFFSPQTPTALKQILVNFDPKKYDPKTIRLHAQKFDKKVFQAKMRQLVSQLWKNEAKDTL